MPLTGIVVEVTPSTVKLTPVPAVMNVIEPEPTGRLVIPEPSPTKNPALTVPENSPEVAESLVKSTALTVIL